MVYDIKHLKIDHDGREMWPNTPELVGEALHQIDSEIYDLATAVYSAPIGRDARYSIHVLEQIPRDPCAEFLQARAVDLFNTITMFYETMGIPPRAVIWPGFNLHPIGQYRGPMIGYFQASADNCTRFA